VSITPIRDPLAGERVIALSPSTATQAASVWLRRPNIFPGRALTQNALNQAQAWAAGHIAKRGQDWVPGVVDGLELAALPVQGTGFAATRLRISPGRALCVSGEDVVLTRVLECSLADVPVVAPPGFFQDGSGVEPGSEGQTPALRPRAIGASLGELAAASLATLPAVAVLLLQPVRVDTADLDPQDPCERSACDEGSVDDVTAFEDWRSADAVRLLWFVWPGEWRALPPLAAAQLRNALAWTVFQAEGQLAVSDALPWEDWGAPIALMALDAANLPLWTDRASVVRQGGRARDARLQLQRLDMRLHDSDPPLVRYALSSNARVPSLWQAQIEQLAEQVAAAGEPAPPADQLADAFGRFLPPVGLLPKSALDAAAHRSGFFPTGYDIDAVPIPVEQLDLAVRQSAGLAPLSLSAPESVRLLVPVPLASWEPRLLQTEPIDAQFQLTLDENLLRRSRTLGLRQGLRNKAAMLAHALNGQTQPVPSFKDDPLALDNESLSPWGEPPPGGGHRGALLPGLHQHFFDSAATPFAINVGESVFVWACLDPDNPPTTLMLQWHNAAEGWEHRAYWGADTIHFGTPDGSAAHLRVGDLPTAGQWVMLKVPADKLGLAGKSVDGMAFTLFDGRAAFGLTGARTDEVWRKWFCNFLPLGAHVQGNEAWDLLSPNDLWAPFEPHGGVVPSLPEVVGAVGGSIFTPGAGAAQGASLAVPRSGFNIYYPTAPGWRGHVLLNDKLNPPLATVALNEADKLRTWIYLDELTPPRALWCAVVCRGLKADGTTTASAFRIAFWGENHLRQLAETSPAFKTLEAQTERAGALPQSGTWVQLDLRAPKTIEGATQLQVLEILFMAFDGNLAFSDLTLQPATQGAPLQMLWPQSIDGVATKPLYQPFLNAKLIAQHNLGVLTPTPSSRIGTVRVYTELVADPLIQKLSGHEQSQLLLRGLSGFADYLRARIDRADDITDFGFAHMQVDIYRIRQLTMSTTDASRLAVSPTLASIAKSDSALAVQSQIKDYISSVKSAVQPAGASGGAGASIGAAAAINVQAVSFKVAAVGIAPARAAMLTSAVSTDVRLIAQPRAPLPIVYSSPIIGLSEIRTTADRKSVV